MAAGNADGRAIAERVARRSYGKLVALLAARTRDVAAAEDALAEAFAAALSTWPRAGVPDNPEAWLVAVSRRRLADAARGERRLAEGGAQLALIAEELEAHAMEDTDIPDRRLGLMFACAHPAIDAAIRTPLILQTVLGLDAARIAAAFLVPAATMGQRLVRAKTKIRDAGIPFHIPPREELPERLDAVLAAIYAAFTTGWPARSLDDARAGELVGEAIWLGRILASLLPGEAEVLGLLALMLHVEARREARRDAAGSFVPLSEQDVTLWNDSFIEEAEALLHRAGRLGAIGRYQIEAAIQSAHAARRNSGRTDWEAIADLYAGLMRLTGSPVVAINHAVALGEAVGPAAGLAALSAVSDERSLESYQPYWAARAELLSRMGDGSAADLAYRRAIELEGDAAVRAFLEKRRAGLPRGVH
jgi:RNA polymerase sigma-70 factor (ECF subfamily)